MRPEPQPPVTEALQRRTCRWLRGAAPFQWHGRAARGDIMGKMPMPRRASTGSFSCSSLQLWALRCSAFPFLPPTTRFPPETEALPQQLTLRVRPYLRGIFRMNPLVEKPG